MAAWLLLKLSVVRVETNGRAAWCGPENRSLPKTVRLSVFKCILHHALRQRPDTEIRLFLAAKHRHRTSPVMNITATLSLNKESFRNVSTVACLLMNFTWIQLSRFILRVDKIPFFGGTKPSHVILKPRMVRVVEHKNIYFIA